MIPAGTSSFNTTADWPTLNVGDTTFSTTILAPDGVSYAQEFIPNATNGYHTLTSAKPARSAAATTYRFMVDAAPGSTYTRVILQGWDGGTAGGNGFYQIYDLANGALVGTGVQFGTSTKSSFVASSIVAIGSGFYRCILDVTLTSTATATVGCVLYVDAGAGQAAVHDSFVGNNTSGVYLWRANVLPLSAWSLVTNKFTDTFSTAGTIDTNNTTAPGYQFYLGQKWPNCVANSWSGYTTVPGSNISVSGGIMTISSDVTGGFGLDVVTAAPASNANGYVGTVFKPPFYMEAAMGFDVTKAQTGYTSWPAIWTSSIEFMTGAVTAGNLFEEQDIFEAVPSGTGTITQVEDVHEWTAEATSSTENSINHNIATGLSGTGWLAQNRFGKLWLTQAATGGNGLMQTYVNGVYLAGSENSYTSAGGSTPAATPSNPAGIFTTGESQHFPMILGAGSSNWAATYSLPMVYTVS